jgi:hypothetical protein
MSNILEPQITETKSTKFSDFIKNNPNSIPFVPPFMQNPVVMPNKGEPYVFLKDFSFSKKIFEGGSPSDLFIGAKFITENYKKDQVVYPFPQPLANEKRIAMPNPAFTKAINEGVLVPQKTAQQQAQIEIARQQAQQQALMQEMSQTSYSGLTDKVFGKGKQGSSLLDPQIVRVGAYMILGAFVGRYVAKNMKKSTTLGMVVGGLAPLLVLKLTMEYDKKNMPKQEPRQKVAVEPTPIPIKKPYMPQIMPSEFILNKLNCPNGTKKISMNCIKAPCPDLEVCA